MQTMRNDPSALTPRIASALPDVVSAGLFLWVWIDPSAWRHDLVAQLMLVMLLEFILVHSAPFLGGAVMAHDQPRWTRIRVVLGLGSIYLLFVGAWAWMFQSLWAVGAFVWLLGSKMVAIMLNRQSDQDAKHEQSALWGLSVMFYLVAVIGTVVIPLPELGVTLHGHAYGIPGSGAWVSDPHIVLAAGVVYFSLLAMSKLGRWSRGMAKHARVN